jgi:hypothetical protein
MSDFKSKETETWLKDHPIAGVPEILAACQVRAARALLDIPAEHLSILSSVSLSTIRRVEKRGSTNKLVISALSSAFAAHGVELVGVTGSRWVNDGRYGAPLEGWQPKIGIPTKLDAE